VAQKNNLKKI